jgi:ATP-dependent DNA helicase RecQ
MINRAVHQLRTVFGFDDFRPLQREIIENVLDRRDSLVVMPTGGGKSLCYQIPALLFPGLTVVVSPLISLMKDQVRQLTELGIDAAVLNSTLTPEEYRETVRRVAAGEVRLLYLAPETLLMPRTLALLDSVSLDLLAIDEAHCISEWGHDFRPEYRQLADIRARFPRAAGIALTATATPRVREDIRKSLRLSRANVFLASFDRPNFYVDVVPRTRPGSQVLDFLKGFQGQSGIVYCISRKQVDDLTAMLRQSGISARAYHAGLPEAERRANQDAFIRDDAGIMVATVAFGMGIDKPNIRFVLHYELPKNIESYYQQIGRAGRDGLPAHCRLLFSYGDIRKISYFIQQMAASERGVARGHLDALVQYAESEDCRRIPLLAYFGEKYAKTDCGNCDNCVADRQSRTDVTVPAQKFLSCVKRTGERFGAAHVADVLRGSTAKKVLKFGHEKLSTHNIGLEFSRNQWLALSRQFLRKGLLEKEPEYGTLRLTPKAWEVMRGNEKVYARVPTESGGESAGPRRRGPVIEHDAALFDLLRARRKALAEAGDVPPYVVFSDRTLMEMAAVYPQSPERMLALHGVGQVKMEKYGAEFLGLIREYCGERGLAEKPGSPRSNPAPVSPGGAGARRRQICEDYQAGKSIDELARELNIKPGTVENHLYHGLRDGRNLRPDGFLEGMSLDDADWEAASAAFERHGMDRLKPVFEELEARVGYDELRRVRLYLLAAGAEASGGGE